MPVSINRHDKQRIAAIMIPNCVFIWLMFSAGLTLSVCYSAYYTCMVQCFVCQAIAMQIYGGFYGFLHIRDIIFCKSDFQLVTECYLESFFISLGCHIIRNRRTRMD